MAMNTYTPLVLNPKSENKEYRCDVCYKYLSVAPILFNDSVGKVCGRCFNDGVVDQYNTETVFHIQKVFENVANYIIFPCSYNSNGCNQQLRWSEVRDHEEICDYKNIICLLSCPKFNTTFEQKFESACKWKGISQDLIYHIRSAHSNFISSSNELTILSSMEELETNVSNKILFFEAHGLFTVAVMHYSKNVEHYFCSVFLDSPFKDCQSYHYDLEVFDLSKKRCLILPGNDIVPLLGRDITKDNKTGLEIDLKVIHQLLQKSPSMTLSFNLMKVSESKIECSGSKLANPGTSQEIPLLVELTCSCGNHLYSPVNICKNGHNCCELCKYTYGVCKTCKDGFLRKTNTTLETITSLVKYPCKNKARGCSYTSDFDSLTSHELNCILTEKDCVVKFCRWRGLNEDMYEHISDDHSILELKEETVFAMNSKSQCYPLLFDNKVFIFTIKYALQSPLSISMQCLGIEKWEYEFEFTILSQSNSINLVSTHLCQPFVFQLAGGTAPARKIEYPFDFLSQFMTNFESLKFKINISKISEKRKKI